MQHSRCVLRFGRSMTKLFRMLLVVLGCVPLLSPLAWWFVSPQEPFRNLAFVALLATVTSFLWFRAAIGDRTLYRVICGSQHVQAHLRMSRKIAVSALGILLVCCGTVPRVLSEWEPGTNPLSFAEAFVGMVILARLLMWIWRRRSLS